jgi:hypothetical protein
MAKGTIKGISDYLEQMREKFPELTEAQLMRILHYGWMQFWIANAQGCDISMRYKDKETYSVLVGSVPCDPLAQYQTSVYKWRKHDRYLFYRGGSEWGEYYYIGLTESEYNKMQPQFASPRRRFIEFTSPSCFNLKGDVVHNKRNKYVFRFKHPPVGFMYKPRKLRIPVKELEFVGVNNK